MKKSMAGLMTVLCAAGLMCGFEADVVLAEDGFTYADVEDHEFVFSSGAGAWGTVLTINEDGTFEGNFHDTDAGASGEDYPNGTRYVCDFSGQFTEPVKVNDYTYSAHIKNMQYAKKPETTEIIDGVQNIYSEPYGLQNAENILFYMDGAPLAELPEEYRSWVGYYDLSNVTEEELPFIGLYNEAERNGFSSFIKAGTEIEDELKKIEEQASVLEDQLVNEAVTQDEMNRISAEIYVLWDDELNSIWSRITEILPEESMDRLTDEELAWISEKEAAIAATGAEVEGGSMQPLVENTKAAELTKSRVYELAEYLK